MQKRLDKIEKVCYNVLYIGYDVDWGFLIIEVHRLYNVKDTYRVLSL